MSKDPKDSKITAEEKALFRATVKKAQRLSNKHKVLSGHQSNEPIAYTPTSSQLTDSDQYEQLQAETRISFNRSGISEKVMLRLKRGQNPVEATLDLHGLTVHEAELALCAFIDSCLEHGKRHILIIHGKGHRGANKAPILKNKVNYWLPQINQVLAFCSASNKDGGTGATYVLLKNIEKLTK